MLVQVLSVAPVAVLEQLLAVIRGEQEHGPIELSAASQIPHEFAELPIERPHPRGITRAPVAHLTTHVVGGPFGSHLDVHPSYVGHFPGFQNALGGHVGASAQGQKVSPGRGVWRVHVHEVQVQEIRSLGVASGEPGARIVQQVVDPREEFPLLLVEAVESLGESVPLRDPRIGNERCRLVSGIAQALGQRQRFVGQNPRGSFRCRLTPVLPLVVGQPVHLRVEGREQRRHRGLGPWRLGEAVAEQDRFLGQHIEIG